MYTNTRIDCTLPAGQGDNRVVSVTVSGQNGSFLIGNFTYDAPVISTVTSNGPTQGGVLITITGRNFGSSGIITIGGRNCSLQDAGAVYRDGADPRIQCVLPAGFGTVQVLVSSGGRTSSPATFIYDAPVIQSISPATSGPTSGSVPLTLVGSNFGCLAGPFGGISLTMTDASRSVPFTVPITACNHTTAVFSLPAGSGSATGFAITVSSVVSNTFTGFSYIAPVITRVQGCTDTLTSATDCPVNPVSTVLTITGSNFGTNPAVTLNGVSCVPTVSVPHSEVRCSLSAGIGLNLPVAITVPSGGAGAQTDSKPFLSYAGPVVTTVTPPVLTLVTGGESITLAGAGFGTNATAVTVQYGIRGAARRYNCTGVSIVSGTVRCNSAAGVGTNHSFTVSVRVGALGIQVSAESTGSLAYPAPTLLPNTTRDSSFPERTSVSGTVSENQQMFFRGTNFGADPALISVRYGTATDLNSVPYGPSVRDCTSVTLPSTNQISCRTVQGSGGPYVFQVTVLNQVSAPGTDTYSYPTPPTVTGVSSDSCVPDGAGIRSCPTQGGVRITIDGTSFAASSADMSIRIGNSDCSGFLFVNSTRVTCLLPAGAGSKIPLLVQSSSLFSQAYALISYKVPTLTTITGDQPCTSVSSTEISGCPRNGAAFITLVGADFGPSGAVVLVGGKPCPTVVQDVGTPHTRVTALLPAGVGQQRDVVLLQGNGDLSPSLRMSYQTCSPGNFLNVSSETCVQCPPGAFNPSQG